MYLVESFIKVKKIAFLKKKTFRNLLLEFVFPESVQFGFTYSNNLNKYTSIVGSTYIQGFIFFWG